MAERGHIYPLFGRRSLNRVPRTGRRFNRLFSELFGRRYAPWNPYRSHRYFVNSDRHKESVDPDATSDNEDDEAEKIKKTLLEVRSADFKELKNAWKHHTEEYDLVQPNNDGGQHLVLRRGDTFDFALTFDRPYNPKIDNVSLVFETGKKPSDGDGTRIVLLLHKEDTTQTWKLMSKTQKGDTLEITVKIPPTCCIGKWSLKVNAINKDKEAPSLKEWLYSKPIFILFNPWCKEDTVYNADEKFIKDYVLEDDGGVYVGNYRRRRYSCKDWAFAQFDSPVLESVLQILEKSKPAIRQTAYSDAVKITRKLTSVVNDFDNNGVLSGRWDGEYSDGKAPTSWSGSQAILEQYYKTKEPVKYGQCWVFSGILTTCLRTLGIPARCVTNSDSAHDTDGSLSIDNYYRRDGSGYIDREETDDSIWNFHVWNDAWMSRPDLHKVGDFDYTKNGWQACDGTPQETSDGVYCCGPTPVFAIKNGDVNIGYDGAFIFAEVNGDVVHWEFDHGENRYVVQRIDEHGVGTGILTSRAGKMENVIGEYKHQDEENERKAIHKASKLIPAAHNKNVYKKQFAAKEEIKMELGDFDKTLYGDSFKVTAKVTNNFRTRKPVVIFLTAQGRFYTGASSGNRDVSSKDFRQELNAGQSKDFDMVVEFEDYERFVLERCIFKIQMQSLCLDDFKYFCADDDIELDKPTITAKAAKNKVKVGDKVNVTVSFQNSLPKDLTQCVLSVEGTGLEKRREIRIRKPVRANQTFTHELEVCPFKAKVGGPRRLLFDFQSKEILDIKGHCDIEVTE